MNKKILLIGAISLFLILLIVSMLRSVKRSPDTDKPSPFSPVATKIPEDRIVISGVNVDNFLDISAVINTNNDRELANTDTYDIVYLPLFETFIITIKTEDIAQARADAENTLLSILDISQEEACKLTIEEYIAVYVESETAGYSYSPSFCSRKPDSN
jgi:hypothetical protein